MVQIFIVDMLGGLDVPISNKFREFRCFKLEVCSSGPFAVKIRIHGVCQLVVQRMCEFNQ